MTGGPCSDDGEGVDLDPERGVHQALTWTSELAVAVSAPTTCPVAAISAQVSDRLGRTGARLA